MEDFHRRAIKLCRLILVMLNAPASAAPDTNTAPSTELSSPSSKPSNTAGGLQLTVAGIEYPDDRYTSKGRAVSELWTSYDAPIRIRITFTNVGKQDVAIGFSTQPYFDAFHFDILHDKEPTPLTAFGKQSAVINNPQPHTGPYSGSYHVSIFSVLGPHQSQSYDVSLSQRYDMTASGIYTVTVHFALKDHAVFSSEISKPKHDTFLRDPTQFSAKIGNVTEIVSDPLIINQQG